MTKREVMWEAIDAPGLQHLSLTRNPAGEISADCEIIGIKDGQYFRLHYTILGDADWNTREAKISLFGEAEKNISLRADGKGNWTNDAGEPIAELDGCADIDISVTAFTNTLPICRLHLKENESAQLRVAYVAVPEMTIKAVAQRYTCLEELSETGGKYRYEGLFRNFTADLPVDVDGLVKDYPQMFRRL